MNCSNYSDFILRILAFVGLLRINTQSNSLPGIKNIKESWAKRVLNRIRLIQWQTVILLAITHGYTVHCLTYSLIYAVKKGKLSKFFFNFNLFTRCFVTCFTYDLFVYHNSRVWYFAQQLDNLKIPEVYDVESLKQSQKQRSKTILTLLSLLFLITCNRVGFNYWYLFENLRIEEYVDRYLYGTRFLLYYKWIAVVAAFLDTTFYLVATSPVYLAYIAVAAIGYDLNEKLKDLTAFVGKRDGPPSEEDRVQFCLFHTQTLNLVKLFNDNFGWLFIVWLVDWGVNYFAGMPAVIDSIWNRKF